MGIRKAELEKHRAFFEKIRNSKKNVQIADIVEEAKLNELKALQGVVRSVLKFSIPLTSQQRYKLKANRVNVRHFAHTRCTDKDTLKKSALPTINSLRTIVQPLFPVPSPDSSVSTAKGDEEEEQVEQDLQIDSDTGDSWTSLPASDTTETVIEDSPEDQPIPASQPSSSDEEISDNQGGQE